MRAGRAEAAKRIQISLDHAAAKAEALGALNKSMCKCEG